MRQNGPDDRPTMRSGDTQRGTAGMENGGANEITLKTLLFAACLSLGGSATLANMA